MSTLFEVFGFPLSDRSQEAEENRKVAHCPFMGSDCDGGGNRYLSNINLKKNKVLQEYFPELSVVPSGICSLQLRSGETPWIICPRRLLFLGKSGSQDPKYQGFSKSLLLQYAELQSGTQLGVWPEINISHKKDQKSFRYTFDYILMPLRKQSQHEIEQVLGKPWKQIRQKLLSAGFPIVRVDNLDYVEEFPVGSPLIIEIMTSSTSGGNKTKRTTIPMAFEDAILGKSHRGPSINYRQVWARMVSQLIVKSEVGLAWGGKTIWVLQDKLVDYISSSTALNIHDFLAKQTSEVNILCFSHQNPDKEIRGVIELDQGVLFAGPIEGSLNPDPSFLDMIRAPIYPPRSILFNALIRRRFINKIISP